MTTIENQVKIRSPLAQVCEASKWWRPARAGRRLIHGDIMLPIRNVARVIVLDSDNFVLLCRYSESRGESRVSYWVPPGGALEKGEDYAAAAIRELREETGLTKELGRELFERRFNLNMQDGEVDQIEHYFLVCLSSRKPAVANTSMEDIEELRWWSIPELHSTVEQVYPDNLFERLETIMME